jgi:hypothetical protein
MELFKNIRLKIGNAILSGKTDRTRKNLHYSGFSQVKNIGIVWDASKTAEFTSLSRFHQRMQEMKIDVRILGYFPGKNLPDQYTAIRYLTCIRKDEINFFYHPVSSETEAFIKNSFDILIDVNFAKLPPLLYITALSKARLKIGIFENESNNSPFDLMMEIKKPVEIEEYFSQTIRYLEMIKDETIKIVDKKTSR